MASTQPISIRPSPTHWSTTTTDDLVSPSSFTSAGPFPSGISSSASMSIHPGPLFVSSSLASSYGMSMSFGSVAGSFGSRLFPGGAGGGPLNPLDPTLKLTAMPSSMESDGGSLLRMLAGDAERCQNYSCCGIELRDMHALLRHFEEAHCTVDGGGMSSPQFAPGSFGSGNIPPGTIAAALAARVQQQQQQQSQNPNPNQQQQTQHHLAHRSSDSALAGALGPVSRSTFYGEDVNAQRDAIATQLQLQQQQQMQQQRLAMKKEEDDERNRDLAMTGGVAAFNVDDMEMDDATQASPMHHQHQHQQQQLTSSPVSSTGSGSGSPHSSMGSGSRSATGSPEAVPSGLVSTHHHQSYVNGIGNAGAMGSSAVSSPPDTPLLATPISPLATTFQQQHLGQPHPLQQQQLTQTQQQQQQYPWTTGVGDGSVTPLASQQQQPTGPSAFDSFHVPAKQSSAGGFGGGATFSSFMCPQPNGFFGNGALFARKGSMQQQQQQLQNNNNNTSSSNSGPASMFNAGMNGYAGYEQYSSGMPGTLAPTTGSMMGHGLGLGLDGMSGLGSSASSTTNGIQPQMLFGAGGVFDMDMPGVGVGRGAQTAPCSGMNTPSTSRAGSPTGGGGGKRSRSKDSGMPSASSSSSTAGASASASASTSCMLQASTTLSRPGAALLLSKPFKCPKPGCMKSYKQANGLKYHMTHGQCSFTPPPEYESLQGLTEREAERKLRPYCCQVPPCQRRYKNMNGLRYHYQHSGEHGAVGLRMLAEGRHDAMKSHDLDEEEEKEDGRRGGTMKVDTTTNGVGNGNGVESPMSVTATSIAAGYPSSSSSSAHRTQNQNQNQATNPNAMSAPPTPSHARFPSTTTWTQQQQQQQQSQPPSAYASPWTSPRSSPPLLQAQALLMQQQQQQQRQSSSWIVAGAPPSPEEGNEKYGYSEY